MYLLRAWLDFLFPPFCANCKLAIDDSFLCPVCWELATPPNPEGRCPHCFEPSEALCAKCKKEPSLPFPLAWIFDACPSSRILCRERPDTVSYFAQLQWARLHWPTPDALVPMPKARSLGRAWAQQMNWAYANVLDKKKQWSIDVLALEEGQTLLLFDIESDSAALRGASLALAHTFPQQCFILKVFS